MLTFLFSLLSLFDANMPPKDCKRQPAFIATWGFDVNKSALSTSERMKMGLVLVEIDPNNPTGKRTKTYQHPSWDDAGYLGPLCIDQFGDAYVAPVPMVNVLHNPAADQNTLYKIDGKTGEMRKMIALPMAALPFQENAFGTLGMAYDCDNHSLYATSVAGSNRKIEKGRIFHIDIATQKVVSQIDSLDAMGIGVGFVGNEKRIFFGKTRTGEICSVGVDLQGNFVGKPKVELTLEGLGARGDDKARKIRFQANGDMTVSGVEFYYNLTAPTEKQETTYTFRYNPQASRWVLIGMQ